MLARSKRSVEEALVKLDGAANGVGWQVNEDRVNVMT